MKTILLAMALALTSLELWAQTPPAPVPPTIHTRPPRFGVTNGPVTKPRYTPPAPGASATPSGSFDATAAAPAEETIPPGTIDFTSADVGQVLEIYAKLVGRTLLHGTLPDAKIVLKTQTPLTKAEAIQALQALLAMNNISLVNIGDKFVKVVTSAEAGTAGGEVNTNNAKDLPNLGTYVMHIEQLKFVKPSLMIPLITPFAKLPNGLTALDDNGILVMRDYAENIKRMLEMIERIDVSVPREYISEVIPIRYAKVDDIASALNSLSGSGGATVSIGSSSAPSQISGLRTSGLSSGSGIGSNPYQSGGVGSNPYQPGGGTSAFGTRTGIGSTAANPNGTPTTGSTFSQRLNNIIQRASSPTSGSAGSQDQIVLFGQTKIIPNESSSSLLIYASRSDMEVIKGIIAKLDVPLAQVLVEAVIIDYTLGNTFTLGVSAAQNPTTLGGTGGNVIGGGGMNNGQSFLTTIQQAIGVNTNNGATIFQTVSATGTNTGSGSFANQLPSGLNYFGNIGPTWDVAVNAAQSDSHASIIQRPRIQTSQAQPAQFFVGESVPYITGSYSYNGVQNSYSQLSVGVELDVTPFINPEGAVTMQIQQEIDAVDNPNYNNTGQPSTIKRTLNTSITVRDKDTVMLGGFIEADKSHSQSGVPFLSDIPLLGNLFKQRNDSKARKELVVLMRPTVLGTPELAAKNTIKETQRLPGASASVAESEAEERKLIDAQRKREQKEFKKTKQYDGFFVPPPEESSTNTAPAAINPPVGTSPNQVTPAPSSQPLADTNAQEKARAAVSFGVPVNLTPDQKQALQELLHRYMADKMTTEEYTVARDKILVGGK